MTDQRSDSANDPDDLPARNDGSDGASPGIVERPRTATDGDDAGHLPADEPDDNPDDLTVQGGE
jgi:hypothetical protein